MWRTAKRRFVRHVCLRNPFLQLLLGISIIYPLPEAGSWERQHAPPPLHYACFMLAKDPMPLSNIPDLCHMQKSIGLVTELWPPRFVTMQWLCSQLCYVTAANQWTVVGIERLATMGWKWGCQPFSCRCSQYVTRCRKEICSTCLFEESIPATLLGISIIHPLPGAGSRERQHAPPPLHCGCIMPIPSLQLQENTCLMQRSRGFGHGVMASKICIDLLHCSDCALNCAMWLLQTNKLLSRLSV